MNATPELFPESAVTMDSPRLRWLKANNLALGELPDGTRFCVGRHAIGYGPTHRDAELELAEAENIKHWEITEFERTMAPVSKPTIDLGEE